MESQQIAPKQQRSAVFLTLPVELRLHIADYALEQSPTIGLPPQRKNDYTILSPYRSSKNLSFLLVCRQFSQDFTSLAYTKTRFTLYGTRGDEAVARMRELSACKLENIRKIALGQSLLHNTEIGLKTWERYVFNEERLHLDELAISWPREWAFMGNDILVPLLRRLERVKVIKLVVYQITHGSAGRALSQVGEAYRSLIGAILKEDHFQRYDAPDAPDIEHAWWEWSFDGEERIITLRAQEPRPVLAESDYMLLVKPDIDALMADAERAAGL
jgi:hypothetical protein